jgi:hypothetical protein
MTTVETLHEAWSRADAQQKATTISKAVREFALCKTAIEDAIMRFNRGMAFKEGRQMDFDFEQSLAESRT